MATLNKKIFLDGDSALIPVIAAKIESSFTSEGYSVDNKSNSGGADLSIARDVVQKDASQIPLALKISLEPQNGGIAFGAYVCVFGRPINPMLITIIPMWTYLAPMWNSMKLNAVYDKALAIAEEVIAGRNDSNGETKAEEH